MRQLWRRVVTVGILSCPLLIHLLIVRGMVAAALTGLAVVSSVAFTVSLLAGRGAFQTACYGLMAVMAWVGVGNGNAFALYCPSVLYNLVFALAFGRTLRAGATPMIERFMRFHRGENIPPALSHYGRQLTYVWTIFFLTMALVAVLLAVFASLEAWSLFANVVNYGLIVGLFLGQFVYAFLRFRTPRPQEVVAIVWRMVRRAAGYAPVGRG